MSSSLLVLIGIIGVIGAIVGVFYAFVFITEFISNHASVLFSIIYWPFLPIILLMPITVFEDGSEPAAIIFTLILTIVLFIVAPQKAVVLKHSIDSHERYFNSKCSIDLDTGRIHSTPGSSSTVRFDEYSLLGHDSVSLNCHDELGIWSNCLVGEDILLFNRIFKYGVMTVPRWWISNISIFILNFTSTILLALIAISNPVSPLVILPSLFYMYYNKKIYYSFAEMNVFCCRKILYWIGIAVDILAFLLISTRSKTTNNASLEIIIIYSVFFLVSSIIFVKKIKCSDNS